ncbi:MAG: heavy metal translocating P-type ATPase, partial [Bryobacteraceae bacterium]
MAKWIALIAAFAIAAAGVMRFGLHQDPAAPLVAAAIIGGVPLTLRTLRELFAGRFQSDVLGVISIAAGVALGENFAAAVIVLMMSGGSALEEAASRRAANVLDALARRMPKLAHKRGASGLSDIPVAEVAPGDELAVLGHEICPVDGVVIEGHGSMDESYLTGEPYQIQKAPGAAVLSGAINGTGTLIIRATSGASASRYAQIVQVVEQASSQQPPIRRLGDRIGSWYTPIALAVAAGAWAASGDPVRFLAVLVVATPCPLLLAIPIAVIGAVSTAARNGIVVRNPAALERIQECVHFLFDKTGTLTTGKPIVSGVEAAPGFTETDVLRAAAALEYYSRHPLAAAIIQKSESLGLVAETVEEAEEIPGHGLRGVVGGRAVALTGRKAAAGLGHTVAPEQPGLECVVLIDGRYAGLIRMIDAPRAGTLEFVSHLRRMHRGRRVVLVSGDREREARAFAEKAGIDEVLAGQTPEQKLAFVKELTASGPTLFAGDGINDAPALLAATVGVAFGASGDVAA